MITRSKSFTKFIISTNEKTLDNFINFEKDTAIIHKGLYVVPELDSDNINSNLVTSLQYLLTNIKEENCDEFSKIINHILSNFSSESENLLYQNDKYNNVFCIALEKSLSAGSKVKNACKFIYPAIWDKMKLDIFSEEFIYRNPLKVKTNAKPSEIKLHMDMLYIIVDLYSRTIYDMPNETYDDINNDIHDYIKDINDKTEYLNRLHIILNNENTLYVIPNQINAGLKDKCDELYSNICKKMDIVPNDSNIKKANVLYIYMNLKYTHNLVIPLLNTLFTYIDNSYNNSEDFYAYKYNNIFKLFVLCDFVKGRYFVDMINKIININKIPKQQILKSYSIYITNAYYLAINPAKDIKTIMHFNDFDLPMYEYFLNNNYLLEFDVYPTSFLYRKLARPQLKSKRFYNTSFNTCKNVKPEDKNLLLFELLECLYKNNKLNTTLNNIKNVCLYLIDRDGDDNSFICYTNDIHSGLWNIEKNILYYYFYITDTTIRNKIIEKYKSTKEENIGLQIYHYIEKYIDKFANIQNSDNENILMVMINFLKQIECNMAFYRKILKFLIDNCKNFNIINNKGKSLINLLYDDTFLLNYLLSKKINIFLTTFTDDEKTLIDYLSTKSITEDNFYNFILCDLYFENIDIFGSMFISKIKDEYNYGNIAPSLFKVKLPTLKNYKINRNEDFDEWYTQHINDTLVTKLIKPGNTTTNTIFVTYLKISNDSTDTILEDIKITDILKPKYKIFEKKIKTKVNKVLKSLIENENININIDIKDSSVFYEVFKSNDEELLDTLLSQERWDKNITVATDDIKVFKYLIKYLNTLILDNNTTTNVNLYYYNYYEILYPILNEIYKIIDEDKIIYDKELLCDTIINIYNKPPIDTITNNLLVYLHKSENYIYKKYKEFKNIKDDLKDEIYNYPPFYFNTKIYTSVLKYLKTLITYTPLDPTHTEVCKKYVVSITSPEYDSAVKLIQPFAKFYEEYLIEYAKHKCDPIYYHIYLDLSEDEKYDNSKYTVIYNNNLKNLNINIDTIFIKDIIISETKLNKIRTILNNVTIE